MKNGLLLHSVFVFQVHTKMKGKYTVTINSKKHKEHKMQLSNLQTLQKFLILTVT